jgi:hypothetical protein
MAIRFRVPLRAAVPWRRILRDPRRGPRDRPTPKSGEPGTRLQLGLFPEVATRPRGIYPGHAANGGEYALLGAGVFRNRDHRRPFGLWWNRVRCGRHCKNTVFHLPGRLRRDAADRPDGQQKPTNLTGSEKTLEPVHELLGVGSIVILRDRQCERIQDRLDQRCAFCETAAVRLLKMRTFRNAINDTPHAEGRRQSLPQNWGRVSKHARRRCRPWFAAFSNSLTRLKGGVTTSEA